MLQATDVLLPKLGRAVEAKRQEQRAPVAYFEKVFTLEQEIVNTLLLFEQ
ncbi:MAG TPA: hypothetical protein VHA06_01465 [Candidatus Angelobacter sp.]|nr:hypothetical protein [Candidatus Angelobacter sp.]